MNKIFILLLGIFFFLACEKFNEKPIEPSFEFVDSNIFEVLISGD